MKSNTNNLHRDFLLRNIEIINDILEALYQSPDHGNKSDPMDELIYIHLSKKTNESGYTKAFDKLSKAFPGWKGLAEANPGRVRKLIQSAGLGHNRTQELLSNVKKIKEEFGKETLGPIEKWLEYKIFDFLTGLDGIGPKSARCIMMYSLGKKVFPVDTHVHTICERMGFIEAGLNHKIAQEELAEYFPEKYRYSLHVNMVAHGRKICRERGKPLCGQCYFNKFCVFYRSKIKIQDKRPKMIDLFCGPGGASFGFSKAGFKIVYAVDNDIHSLDTHYLNHPELTMKNLTSTDIRDIPDTVFKKLKKKKIDLVIGGPPCQGWSGIGKHRKKGNKIIKFLKDDKNKLYREFVRVLNQVKPQYFVMENVPGLLTAHEGKYAKTIMKDFRKHGYASNYIVVNAMNYGIPQSRIRIFFIGTKINRKETKKDAKKRVSEIIKSINELKSENPRSFRWAMKGLPHLMPGEGSNIMRINGKKLQGSKEKPDNKILVFNHFARIHNPRDLEIYRLLSEGENYLGFSRRIKKKRLLPYSNKSFHTKYRKLKRGEPCFTIISHLNKDANSYIHPGDNRGITVREAARIQSFPDEFIFLGQKFRQFIQVGNAVPPKLAEIIGNVIIEKIGK